MDNKVNYLLRLGDNALILSQRCRSGAARARRWKKTWR
jgi:hypothetical protein